MDATMREEKPALPHHPVHRPRRLIGPGQLVAMAVLVVIALVSVLPILWLVLTGFKPTAALIAKTPQFIFQPTLEHYQAIFAPTRRSVASYFVNSLVVSVLSTTLSIGLGMLAAFALARLRPRGHNRIGFLILSMRLMPPIALIVPFYLTANKLGILDTRLALIITYTGLNVPLATWLLVGFLIDLPRELEEAARVDGCTYLGAFFRVILPLAGPGLAAASVFSFVLAWNDLAIALALAPFNATTLPVLAASVRTEEGVRWGQLGGITTLIMLPAILFTLLASRWLVKGMTAGAVK